MQKISWKTILFISLFSFLIILSLPAQVAWAGHEAQTVPKAKPTAKPTSAGDLPDNPTAAPINTAVSTKTIITSETYVPSVTPRVFPTRDDNLPAQAVTATSTVLSESAAVPEDSATMLAAQPTDEEVRPVTASLTAVANSNNVPGESASPLACPGGLLVLAPLFGAAFFLRRAR